MEQPKKTILIVDDMPENLDYLDGILSSDYNVKVALNGFIALKIAIQKPSPDLILMDIMMPDMDGYQACEKLKSSKETSGIPLIFVTAKNEVDDETKGFKLGAVDYITKPFHPEIIKQRVRTHLRLKEAESELQLLLKQTLFNSIKVLMEILSLSNSHIFHTASRINRYIKKISVFLNLKDSLNIELAALLSQIGYVTLPPDIMEKYNKSRQADLLTDQIDMIKQVPAIGAELIAKIPRMESVAIMIKNQDKSFADYAMTDDLDKISVTDLGSQMLKAVIDFDKQFLEGASPNIILEQFYKQRGMYNPKILSGLKKIIQEGQVERNIKRIEITSLEEGMILDENIYDKDNVLLVKKGLEFTAPILHRLHHLAKISRLSGKIRVMIPFNIKE